jgi:hypothetical protein
MAQKNSYNKKEKTDIEPFTSKDLLALRAVMTNRIYRNWKHGALGLPPLQVGSVCLAGVQQDLESVGDGA